MSVQVGDFIRLRGRRWLVEGELGAIPGAHSLRLACIDDDAQGETTDVVWDAELDGEILVDDGWSSLSRSGTDDPEVFSAYLRTLGWGAATAAERDLFQAPFRAGIRLDAYQLLPLRKALRLPRVNLLVADDVGAGKTVEAGLVMREMMLRRRVDFVVVAAPAGMTRQWQDEIESKFGVAFTIIDRDHLAAVRRDRGFGMNAWSMGSHFIVSHSLLTDDTYAVGLRDAVGAFCPRSMLILDEAHHAAPSSGSRYAVDSQFTRAVRDLAARFEHRLFLSATPHNGHSNSFSALLEMLDPQRFTRGVPVRPAELEAVMVRRLKSDLRHFGERFPRRLVAPIIIDGLDPSAPDLDLSRRLARYAADVHRRLAAVQPRDASVARLALIRLQQRLLSSPRAFADTLKTHVAAIDAGEARGEVGQSWVYAETLEDTASEPEDHEQMRLAVDREEREEKRRAEAEAAATAPAGDRSAVLAMLEIAERAAQRPDARMLRLAAWVRDEMISEGAWNDRRLVIFTEFEATRRWLQRLLTEILHDLSPDERIAVYTGSTPFDRREELKRRFNADPAIDPLRILICTDAAREGINLQGRCRDLIHFDLPWNPARLEQRNGRIDRKLQPAAEVSCRYFLYAQREEDIVLKALVEKTERIREQLGSAGQVLAHRVADRLEKNGIFAASTLAEEISGEDLDNRSRVAAEEMDDQTERRRARQACELDDLRRHLEASRNRVGVDPEELRSVFSTALGRAGVGFGAPAQEIGGTPLFKLDAAHPAFSAGGWQEALDALRVRRRSRADRTLRDWRAAAPLRALSFRPAITPEGADAEDVVQLHLEHRLVRRLLGRFLSQGFQSGLSRACVVVGPGAQPRVVLIGRLALYGPGAARLHEEMVTVTAPWTEAGRGAAPLKPFGARGEETTMAQLQTALRDPRRPPAMAVERIRAWAEHDAADLEPDLRQRAENLREKAALGLAERGAQEAEDLRRLIADQHNRIAKASETPEDLQMKLFDDAEQRREEEIAQMRRDQQHWRRKLAELDAQLVTEPARVRENYAVRAHRVDVVGLLYLWPASN